MSSLQAPKRKISISDPEQMLIRAGGRVTAPDFIPLVDSRHSGVPTTTTTTTASISGNINSTGSGNSHDSVGAVASSSTSAMRSGGGRYGSGDGTSGNTTTGNTMSDNIRRNRPPSKVTFAPQDDVIHHHHHQQQQQKQEHQHDGGIYGSMSSADGDTAAAPMTHKFVSPSLEKGSIRMRSREERTRAARAAGLTSSGGTVSNPDFADTLRRVSVVVQQHIVRGERLKRRYKRKRTERREQGVDEDHLNSSGFDELQSPSPVVSFSSEGSVGLIGDSRSMNYRGVGGGGGSGVGGVGGVGRVGGAGGNRQRQALQMTSGGGRGEEKWSARGPGGGSGGGGVGPGGPSSMNPATAMPLGERLAASSNFHEDIFVKPVWQYTFVRTPGLFLSNYQMEKVQREYTTPDVGEIHDFINNLFMKGQVRCRT